MIAGMSGSGSWIRRQAGDIFVRKAKAEGYRARSAYKLIEINNKFKLIRPGSCVAECGSAPGAWTQVAATACNAQGYYSDRSQQYMGAGIVVGCDLLDIEPISGVVLFRKSDFTLAETQQKMVEAAGHKSFDVVLSDMAPNASGSKALDSDSIIRLSTLAMRFAILHSRPGGHFVTKIWDGKDKSVLLEQAQRFYEEVEVCKPKASRKDSSELYIIARYFRGLKSK